MGSVVKVCPSSRSSSSSRCSLTLRPALRDDTLRELFAHLGRIASITFVGSGQFGSGTKEALVEFADPGAAAIAMHLTGTELADHMLLVTSHTPAPAAAPVASVSNVAALFAGFVPTALPVQPVNSLMGTALGQGVPGTNIKNPYVTPQLYQLDPSKADEIGRTVYVGNISLLISELDLTQMFSACGPVTFIKMAGDPAHGCRFAFVEFERAEVTEDGV
ncbi:hypothetical protein BC830DRAFT_1175451 [Chytriomyces sp. MP71]|nr:hypothetical protein BC830DRAFT_1175451 [Chytriomyces sp. MP71]